MAEEKKPTDQEKKEASSKAAGTAKKSTTKAASTKKTTKTATAKAPAKTVQRVRKTTQKAEQITETIHHLLGSQSQITTYYFRQAFTSITQRKHSGEIIMHRTGKNTSQHNPQV